MGLVMWTAIMASWNLRNAVKFHDTPPTWDIFLTQWLCILARWHAHPAPTPPQLKYGTCTLPTRL